MGHDYEVPLSLNAEICFSEFVSVEKKERTSLGKAVKVSSLIEDMRDLSDLLYNAYAEA